MPRLVNTVPKYRKHRASGQAFIEVGGRRYYLGPHGTKASRLEYDRRISEWLANGRSAHTSEESPIAVVELLARYLKWARKYYRKDGCSTGQIEAALPTLAILRDLYGRSPAVDFGPLALKACRVKMIEKDWARTHINRSVGAIKRVFKWAAGEQLLPASVYDNLRIVTGLKKGGTDARESNPIEPVLDAAVQATLPELPEVVSDMVRFQRLVGCRPAEVCIVRPYDVNMSSEVWIYRPESHKNEHHGKDRVIFVGPKAQDILRPYLLRSSESYCFSPQDSERKRRAELTANRRTPLSCGNKIGSNRTRKPKCQPRDQYDTCSYRRAIHRGCDKAFPHPTLGRLRPSTLTKDQEVELGEWQSEHRWSPNRLRHSAGTEIRKRFGLEAAQVTLGHAKADTTQLYAERDHELAASVARQIG